MRILVKPSVEYKANIFIPDDLLVLGDSHRLTQVIINMITNATKFTLTGSIEFTVAVAAHNKANKTQELLFSVKDTGIGMDESTRKKLFKPFVQVPSFN